MRRLVCLLSGHDWDEWRGTVIAGWATNMVPEGRYCLRCDVFQMNDAARILTAVAFGREWLP